MKQGKIDKDIHCPSCNHTLNGFTNIGGNRSLQPGDITICAYCGSLLEFNNHFDYEFLTDRRLQEKEMIRPGITEKIKIVQTAILNRLKTRN